VGIKVKKVDEKITTTQLGIIIASTTIGVSILALPKHVVDAAGVGAPLASLVGILIGFFGLLFILLLGKRFPKHTIIGYQKTLLGKKLGNILSFIIILYFYILFSLETRQFSEVIKITLLSDTPLAFPILFIIFLCAAISYKSAATFTYIHIFYIPYIFFPLLFILIQAYKDVEFYHLLPILGHHQNFASFIDGALKVTQEIMNIFVITMIIPFMTNPQKNMKGAFLGYIISCFIIFITIFMCLGVFGEEEMKRLFWPTLILGRIVQIPSQVLARIDSILVMSWIFAVFTTLMSYYYVIVRGIAELFHFPRHRFIAFASVVVTFIISLIPKNIYDVYHYIFTITRYGLILTIIYPFILLVIAIIRKKKGTEI
jgi:spore germination protein